MAFGPIYSWQVNEATMEIVTIFLGSKVTADVDCIYEIIRTRGRSGGLVFPSLSEFSTVYCDPYSQRLWHSQ